MSGSVGRYGKKLFCWGICCGVVLVVIYSKNDWGVPANEILRIRSCDQFELVDSSLLQINLNWWAFYQPMRFLELGHIARTVTEKIKDE